LATEKGCVIAVYAVIFENAVVAVVAVVAAIAVIAVIGRHLIEALVVRVLHVGAFAGVGGKGLSVVLAASGVVVGGDAGCHRARRDGIGRMVYTT
jgi:hypothetical protein